MFECECGWLADDSERMDIHRFRHQLDDDSLIRLMLRTWKRIAELKGQL